MNLQRLSKKYEFWDRRITSMPLKSKFSRLLGGFGEGKIDPRPAWNLWFVTVGVHPAKINVPLLTRVENVPDPANPIFREP
jgi:hypothetical protein